MKKMNNDVPVKSDEIEAEKLFPCKHYSWDSPETDT